MKKINEIIAIEFNPKEIELLKKVCLVENDNFCDTEISLFLYQLQKVIN